ncbi:hypothetical protein [Haloferula sp.]|uniref:hypothetical protein n=1 Tax=Haloferula sp. TaxID=2497595 RepID=UPI00329A9196
MDGNADGADERGGRAMTRQTWLVVRIVVALMAIFVMGMWVGRMTAPKDVEIVEVVAEGGGDNAERQRGTYGDRVSMRVVPRYREALDLTEEQLEELRPAFIQAGRDMARYPAKSEGRFKTLLKFHETIRPALSDEQKEKLEGILEQYLKNTERESR